jgi:hypothetical protein
MMDAELRSERGAIGVAQALPNLDQPLLVTFRRALVQRREGTEYPGLAGLDDEIGAGHEEHRRRHRRDSQAAAKLTGKHGCLSFDP